MSVARGFEVLTATYLGEDWELFGKTADEAIENFARNHREDVAPAIAGFENLLATPMSEHQYYDRWVLDLDSGYDPRRDGFTFQEWFTHALGVLRTAADA